MQLWPQQLGVVVTRWLITAGHVVLRFKQYNTYPCRAVLMSKTWNPDGFHPEFLRFLATPETCWTQAMLRC